MVNIRINRSQLDSRYRLRSAREVAHWCGRFERYCRERGIRVTAQRLSVYRALAEDTTHPTAESIHSRLRLSMSSLSLATVYRILEFFEKEGLVLRVSSAGGVGRFDVNVTKHQHLVCRLCGNMADIQDDSLARLEVPQIDTSGFIAEEFDIRVLGRCKKCRPEPASRCKKRLR